MSTAKIENFRRRALRSAESKPSKQSQLAQFGHHLLWHLRRTLTRPGEIRRRVLRSQIAPSLESTMRRG
jgi:hypothetical protein